MTVIVPPGTEDCYFLPDLKPGWSLEVDYEVEIFLKLRVIFLANNKLFAQVVDTSGLGSADGMNIGLKVINPHEVTLEVFEPLGQGSYFAETRETGDYKICLVIIMKESNKTKSLEST